MIDRFRRGTKQYFIALLAAQGFTNTQAYNELKPKVAAQIEPWVFTRNPDRAMGETRRMPKPLALQYKELQDEINRVYTKIAKDGNPVPADEEMPDDEMPQDEPTPEDEIEDEPVPEIRPVKSSVARKENEKAYFYNEWVRLRQWISDTATNTGAVAVDSLDTMRPLVAASKMIDAGISARQMLHAMCMHWPKATLDMAGVSATDYSFLTSHVEPVAAPENAKLIVKSEPVAPGFHVLSGYVKTLIEQRQNIMLIGPAGTGKSFLARQIAEYMNLDYDETAMSSGATRGDLLGRHTLDGFIQSPFERIYVNGGVHNFEEIDTADPSTLVTMNNALANPVFTNTMNGKRCVKHPDFVAIATANTFGLGADSKYTAREKLDLATIDRFRMGRVLVTLDEDLARSMIIG